MQEVVEERGSTGENTYPGFMVREAGFVFFRPVTRFLLVSGEEGHCPCSLIGLLKTRLGGFLQPISLVWISRSPVLRCRLLYQVTREGRNEVEEVVNSALTRKTILLVDDEEMVIDVGEKMLRTIGYDVLVARSGREAIEIVREACQCGEPEDEGGAEGSIRRGEKAVPDLVILDMLMPDIGGGETYDRLMEINPHIKVILASGYSVEDQAQDILARGCNGFIQKPFDLRQLASKIKEVIE